jgi:NagD protein
LSAVILVLVAPPAQSWLCDLDGVFVREGTVIPGAVAFLEKLRSSGRKFLILTNNSMFTPRDLAARLEEMGLEVPESQLWTSALATAEFVASQRPGGTAFVIGESGLTHALHEVGYTLSNKDPDYVILGETRTYSFQQLSTAVRLVESGSRFLCTNPDPTGPSPEGPIPACGAVAAMIERATRISPYFVGKPNPLMMREGLNRIGAHSESTVMIGDRMDTDVLAGIEAGMATILVLSGVTSAADVERFPYRPGRIVDSVADLIDEL